MRRLSFLALGLLLFHQTAAAEPIWSQIAFTARPSDAPKVVAAVEKFMSSDVGKTFKGKLLLQANVADGASPATHTFVPIYATAAESEAFVQNGQGKPAWNEFLGMMEKHTQPVSTVRYRVLQQWGDINDTDHVWMAHTFDVQDGAKLTAALDKLMKSGTGKKFPGQVYLSAVVAGGQTSVSHVISVGYDSEAEMAAWLKVRDPSPDWAAYQEASQKVSEYLGGSLVRDVKSWGPATLKGMFAP